MSSRLILVGVMSLTLAGCALYWPSAGNPNGDAYLGQRSSAYETTANPPSTVGQVSYNPSAPLPEITQPAVSSGSALGAPAPH